MTAVKYAELHCVSNFTFLRGASHPGELIHEAANLGYSALALTDECSMAGVVRAYEAAQRLDFKLIVGSEFRTTDGPHLVLLAHPKLPMRRFASSSPWRDRKPKRANTACHAASARKPI